MSALSDALNEANVEGWSAAEIARRSGDLIHRATAANVMRGKHAANPPDKVLEAFAVVFPSLSLEQLRQLAGRPGGKRQPYEPPAEADLLDERQRRAVDELIRSMVNSPAVIPEYLTEVFDSLTPAETVWFLRDLQGTSRERLDMVWRHRRRWLEDGGLPVWEDRMPEHPEYPEAHGAYEESVFARAPDGNKGRPPAEWHRPEPAEPDLATVLRARLRSDDEDERDAIVSILDSAAREGTASLRDVRRRQDEAGEAPDPDGPEGGA